MFTHLIESGSHKKDMARRGRFFLGTLGFYALLLLVAGTVSVYAYNVQLDSQEAEITLVTPIPATQVEESRVVRPPLRTTPATGPTGELIRKVLIADINRPLTPTEISTHRAPPPSPPGSKVGDRDVDGGIAIGPPNHNSNMPGAATAGVIVPVAPVDDPLPPKPRPTPAPEKLPNRVRLSSVVISSKIISKPVPPYPALAKQARVQGSVMVEILIDEQGRVISAQATNGHPLLRAAAQGSALQAKFSPTSISGQPVKVSGVITYNFVLQ